MKYEKVYTTHDFYDGVRSGTADFKGVPHYFSCIFSDTLDEWTDQFRLYPVTSEFMERELKSWKIFRDWADKFQSGLVPLESHPTYPSANTEYDELKYWLADYTASLTPLAMCVTGIFRRLPGNENRPGALVREFEVAWTSVET